MPGIVYCLTNPAMPDYVKIGWTSNLEQRLRALDNTSVPLPFECVFTVEVDNPEEAERLAHDAFEDRRTRSTREFFEVNPQQVIAALRLTGGRDVTPGADIVEDAESERALQEARQRRSNLNFDMVAIPVGTQLEFRANASEEPSATAVVSSRNRITFEGKEYSLSGAAAELLARRGMATSIAGTAYWYYEGESLVDRRRRMEGEG